MQGTKQDNDEKKPYVTPKLTVHGDLVTLTQGDADGDALDASFPVGTKKVNLTFS